MMTKAYIFSSLLMLVPLVQADTVEVDILGMSCSFCVEGLQDRLSRLPDVAQVDVSLKNKVVRIVSEEEPLDMDRVRSAIIEAGFTPAEVRHIRNDEQ